jgi:hypothetical protein
MGLFIAPHKKSEMQKRELKAQRVALITGSNFDAPNE